MAKADETKPKKKRGIFTLLKESMTRTSEGCGPGCGCHEEAKNERKEGKADAAAKGNRK